MSEQQQEVQIQASPEVLTGVYANQTLIQHSPDEFVLDFVFANASAGSLNARVVITPAHAERLVAALEENIQRYENVFGEIKQPAVKPTPDAGVVH